ncbi:variable surface protein, partial [Plasmodium gonderi]
FDFRDIYPQCRIGFEWKFPKITGDVGGKLTNLCNKFNLNNRNNNRSSEFIQRCQHVTFYLNHIKRVAKEYKINPCCKYFFYKLKGLLNNFPCNCVDTKSCYAIMKTLSEQQSIMEISSLFSQCSDYPKDLNENIYQIFKKIDETYDNLYEFIRYPNPGYYKYVNFRNGMKYLESRQYNYNDSFKDVLNYFKHTCLAYLNELNPTDSSVRSFLQYLVRDKNKGEYTFAEINAIKGIVNVAQMGATKGIHNVAKMDRIKGTDIGSQISTGISLLFFSILIIMFILYKYTPFGSYLQPRGRRLRKLMKIKNKKHKNLIDSYQNMNNELNDKHYDVGYRSI